MGVKGKEQGPALTRAYVRRNLVRSLLRKCKALGLPDDEITITEEMISVYREVITARRLLRRLKRKLAGKEV